MKSNPQCILCIGYVAPGQAQPSLLSKASGCTSSIDRFANWNLVAYEAKTFTPARFTFNGAVTNLRDPGEVCLFVDEKPARLCRRDRLWRLHVLCAAYVALPVTATL